ncbi:MAG: Methyltransferase type 11, partial [Sediminibacterium sp.]|nr:Methyltransferase type 11 [Sediminibacterium sp.]
ARIIRHLPALIPGAALYGCDINEEMITWNKAHHGEIAFTTVNNFAPLPYAPAFFDLVYGLSVLTHISAENQQDWIMELHRVIKNQALLLVTTQGKHYEHKLIPAEKKVLVAKGIYTKSFMKSGHRMMSTYHSMAAFKNLIAPYFDVLELHEGHQHPARMGGQDVWILRKKEASMP